MIAFFVSFLVFKLSHLGGDDELVALLIVISVKMCDFLICG